MCALVYVCTHLSMNIYISVNIPVYDGVLKIHTPINGRTPNIYDRSHDSTRFSSARSHRSLSSSLSSFSMSPVQSAAVRYFVILDDICTMHVSIVRFELGVITCNFRKVRCQQNYVEQTIC